MPIYVVNLQLYVFILQISVDICESIRIIRNILTTLLRKNARIILHNFINLGVFQMKKQLLIAAVAATMTSVAMADLSISGSYEAVFSDTGSVSEELDMKFVGKADAGTVTMTLNDVETGTLDFDQVYVTSTVEGISVKAGAYKGLLGNGLTFKKGSAGENKVKVSTKVAGISIAHSNNDKTDISGSISGVSIKMQDALNSTRMISISTDIAGVAVAAEKNDDTTAFSLTTELAGMTVTYASIDATAATQDDGILGNIAGLTNVTGLNIQANTAAGKVTVKAMQSDTSDVTKVTLKRGNVTYGYNDSTDALSAKIAFNF